MKYQAVLTQTATCVVTFDAPENATPEELDDAANQADMPSLCHGCSDSRNQSLNIEGEWTVSTGLDGQPEIHAKDES